MTEYQVFADHTHDQWKLNGKLVKTKSTTSDQDHTLTVFYVSIDNFGCSKCYRTEKDAILGLLQDNGCTNIRILLPVFNHDAHVRCYYDQPADQGSKFTGERLAVYAAYTRNNEGFGLDDFGSVDELGYYARVCFKDCPFIVCFREDSQGLVTEMDCDDYEAIWAQYIENIWEAE